MFGQLVQTATLPEPCGLWRLFGACAGKSFEARRDTALTPSC
jgi:hypothetical protein